MIMMGPAATFRTIARRTLQCHHRTTTTTITAKRAFHRSATFWQQDPRDGRGRAKDEDEARSDKSIPVTTTRIADVLQQQRKKSTGVDEASSSSTPWIRPPRKRLDVAIVGLPNGGKSQLLNCFTGTPVSAVSRKRHTTREGVLGARTLRDENNVETQLIFVDTPGFMRFQYAKKEGLNREIMVTARDEMHCVDYTLIVVDAAKNLRDDVKASLIDLMLQALMSEGRVEAETLTDDEGISDDDESKTDDDEEAEKEGMFLPFQKFGVVLNKVDLVEPKERLLSIASEIFTIAHQVIVHLGQANIADGKRVEVPEEVLSEIMPVFFYTDARKGEGVDDVLEFLVRKATPAKFFEMQPGQATIMEPEDHAEEIIREKLYRCLHKELPYAIKQENQVFRVARQKNGELGVMIQQDLLVRTKSHRELVIGTGERTLKRIQETAERSLSDLWGCKVVLQLHVKLVTSKSREWSI